MFPLNLSSSVLCQCYPHQCLHQSCPPLPAKAVLLRASAEIAVLPASAEVVFLSFSESWPSLCFWWRFGGGGFLQNCPPPFVFLLKLSFVLWPCCHQPCLQQSCPLLRLCQVVLLRSAAKVVLLPVPVKVVLLPVQMSASLGSQQSCPFCVCARVVLFCICAKLSSELSAKFSQLKNVSSHLVVLLFSSVYVHIPSLGSRI